MSGHRIPLREMPNAGCQSCQRHERKDNLEDGICQKTVSVDDHLPIRCVGEWAYDKIYWLVQYFGIFSQGMKNRWEGLNYVEICSGPGRCVTRNDRKEMDGTALAIVRHENFSHLTKALFIDANQKVVEALNKRILAAGVNGKATAEVGDYENQAGIRRLIAAVPRNCLNLVFIDPTDCGIPFATIKLIADQLKNVDFIINVALHTDANRNLVAAVTNPAFSDCRRKYERFLGVPNFCARPDVVKKAKHGDFDDLRLLFLEEYRRSLKDQGFLHSDAEQVKHYYYVLFASRNAKGLQFWKEITKIRPDNQRTLDLSSN